MLKNFADNLCLQEKWYPDISSQVQATRDTFNVRGFKLKSFRERKLFSTYKTTVPSSNDVKSNIISPAIMGCGNKHWLCSYGCGTSFTTKTGMREHEKIKHEGTYRYTCEQCGKGFMIKNHYEGHMNAHMNYKPFQCQQCHKSFSHKRSIIKHTSMCMSISK